MKLVTDYDWNLALFADDTSRRRLMELPLDVDWTPAEEAALWELVRQAADTDVVIAAAEGRIEPDWDQAVGMPYLSGFQIITAGGAPQTLAFPIDYFRDAAQQAVARLIAEGTLPPDTTCKYAVFAMAKQTQPQNELGVSHANLVAAPRRVRLRSTPHDVLFDDVRRNGQADDDTLPVIVPQAVLDEVVSLHERAGDVETGGVLVGHLHRDAQHAERVTIEITGQIPARYATEARTRLTFLPETWSEGERLLKLRGLGEIKIGWWHTHPGRAWCGGCPEERRRACPVNRDFFSAHDVALHRVCFAPSYCVALVVSDTYAHGLSLPMFGWRQGRVAPRGYFVRGARTAGDGPHVDPTAPELVSSLDGGSDGQPCS